MSARHQAGNHLDSLSEPRISFEGNIVCCLKGKPIVHQQPHHTDEYIGSIHCPRNLKLPQERFQSGVPPSKMRLFFGSVPLDLINIDQRSSSRMMCDTLPRSPRNKRRTLSGLNIGAGHERPRSQFVGRLSVLCAYFANILSNRFHTNCKKQLIKI